MKTMLMLCAVLVGCGGADLTLSEQYVGPLAACDYCPGAASAKSVVFTATNPPPNSATTETCVCANNQDLVFIIDPPAATCRYIACVFANTCALTPGANDSSSCGNPTDP